MQMLTQILLTLETPAEKKLPPPDGSDQMVVSIRVWEKSKLISEKVYRETLYSSDFFHTLEDGLYEIYFNCGTVRDTRFKTHKEKTNFSEFLKKKNLIDAKYSKQVAVEIKNQSIIRLRVVNV